MDTKENTIESCIRKVSKPIRFPRDCWNINCPYFKVWDLSVDDLTCYCEDLRAQVDACDEDFYT